jgi:dipeptidyl aminopeptidase/acylaminoacyl peptidase
MRYPLIPVVSLAALVALGGLMSVSAEESKKPLDAATLWKVKRLSAPDLSPDGALAVVPVSTPDLEQDKIRTDLWLVPTDGGEPRLLTTHEGNESNPAWSPDGKWIAFEAKRAEDDENQIYVIPTDGGEARRITRIPTGASAPKWFPDSKRVAFLSRVWIDLGSWDEQAARLKERKEDKMTARVWDRLPVRYWDRWIDDRQAHVFTIGLEGGDPNAVTTGTGRELSKADIGRDSYDISPDGREIAFAADVDPTGVDPNFDVFVVPAAGGEAQNVSPENPADDFAPCYSPDGRHLAFLRQTVKGFYADRVRLVLRDRQAGTNRVMTEDWDRSARGLVWSRDSRSLFASVDDSGHDRVYRIDAVTGRPSPVTGERSFSALALSMDGSTLVALRQGFREPPTLVRLDPDTGDTAQLSTFNDELLASVALGTYESVTYEGARGDSIQMWIVYPPGFDRTKKWPLYMLLHGGPHNAVTDSWHNRWNAQVFAGWGYVTAWHNFHGSSGFGQEFADSINPDRATLPYEDTLKAVDWLASKPWIDGDRMGASGASYGGYLGSLILGREHPFKTLIIHAAVYNMYTQYAADYGGERRRFGEFWEYPDRFADISPHLQAGNFSTPALVIHGDKDYRVPLNHGIELFQTLQNRGIRSRLVYYPDENHWVLRGKNSIFWYDECRKWMSEFAKEGGR